MENNDPFNKVLTFAETSIFSYMRYKLLIPAAFALIALACHSNDQRKKINAGLLEVSVFGEAGGKTISIDSNGIVRKCFYRPGAADCFMDTIDNKNIDSINYYLGRIKNTSIDSLYEDNCIGCSTYIVRIDIGEESITTMMTGNNSKAEIGKFAKFITGMRVYEGTKVDSVFSFTTGMKFSGSIPGGL
jgi:hypothetical protein